MRTRITLIGLLATAAFALSGCGGGGGGGGGVPTGTASLSGRVVERDGTTSNLSGLRITLLRTGESLTTDGTGAFDFGSVPTGTLALRVVDPLAPLGVRALGTDDGSDDGDATDDDSDDDGDDHDVGDDDFDVLDVEDGEEIHVDLEVDDGEIVAVRLSCSEDEEREAEVHLVRADASDDPDVEGEAEIESESDGQKLEVEAEHLAPGREVRAFVICEGVEADLGLRTADADGEAEWEIDTSEGGVLPHGATTVEELVGCDVEVRDAGDGTVLLTGTLPDLPAVQDGEDDEDGEDEGDEAQGRALLVAAGGVPGEAHVEIESKVEDGQTEQGFEAEVEGQTPGLVVDVWMEDAVGSGVLALVGSFTVGGEGEGELEMETDDGGSLPLGVADVNDLVGRAVELRDAADDSVLFTGTVPALVGG